MNANSPRIEKVAANSFVVFEGSDDKFFVEVTYLRKATRFTFMKPDHRLAEKIRKVGSRLVRTRLRNDGAIANKIAELIAG